MTGDPGPDGTCKAGDGGKGGCQGRYGAPSPTRQRTSYEESTTTEAGRANTVAQEILLVPRTVYVPYAAQVPVTTMRVTRTSRTQQGQTTVTTSDVVDRSGPAPAGVRDPGCADAKELQALKDKCAEYEKRLEELSKKVLVGAPSRTTKSGPSEQKPEVLPTPLPANVRQAPQ